MVKWQLKVTLHITFPQNSSYALQTIYAELQVFGLCSINEQVQVPTITPKSQLSLGRTHTGTGT